MMKTVHLRFYGNPHDVMIDEMCLRQGAEIQGGMVGLICEFGSVQTKTLVQTLIDAKNGETYELDCKKGCFVLVPE